MLEADIGRFDVLTSSGLNVYVPEEEKGWTGS